MAAWVRSERYRSDWAALPMIVDRLDTPAAFIAMHARPCAAYRLLLTLIGAVAVWMVVRAVPVVIIGVVGVLRDAQLVRRWGGCVWVEVGVRRLGSCGAAARSGYSSGRRGAVRYAR